jgi:hypothetical protein
MARLYQTAGTGGRGQRSVHKIRRQRLVRDKPDAGFDAIAGLVNGAKNLFAV